uniref:Uncharacterized protein n=1 Tax=Sipha flava TaxID=143950 RepID=A0A2S2Q9P1_9HEMI
MSSLTLHSYLLVSDPFLRCLSILFCLPSGRFLFIFLIRTFFNTSPSALHTCPSHSRRLHVYESHILLLNFYTLISTLTMELSIGISPMSWIEKSIQGGEAKIFYQ